MKSSRRVSALSLICAGTLFAAGAAKADQSSKLACDFVMHQKVSEIQEQSKTQMLRFKDQSRRLDLHKQAAADTYQKVSAAIAEYNRKNPGGLQALQSGRLSKDEIEAMRNQINSRIARSFPSSPMTYCAAGAGYLGKAESFMIYDVTGYQKDEKIQDFWCSHTQNGFRGGMVVPTPELVLNSSGRGFGLLLKSNGEGNITDGNYANTSVVPIEQLSAALVSSKIFPGDEPKVEPFVPLTDQQIRDRVMAELAAKGCASETVDLRQVSDNLNSKKSEPASNTVILKSTASSGE